MNTPNATPSDSDLPGEPFIFREAIGQGLAVPESFTIRHVTVTGSTNDDLVRVGSKGAPHRLVLVADSQSAGKGRLNRRWEAKPGANLLVSLLFREIPRYPHQLTHAVALAAQAAASQVAGVATAIKWPNDLLAGGRKIAGILSAAGGGQGRVGGPMYVVVGLGLNVGWAPEGAASLDAESGRAVSREAVLASLLVALDKLLALDEQKLFQLYRSRLDTLRRMVRIELPGGEVLQGRALDVDVDGRLKILDQKGSTRLVDVGDIVHLR